MFNKTDHRFFFAAIITLAIGFSAMAFDPADNGFGILTLWIAPPLLLLGFILPIAGILGLENIRQLPNWKELRLHTHKHVFGFVALVISFFTYLLTLEPTASLWDCSEFIASSYKLQVPHSPGTPLSLLVGRLFTMLAFGDTSKVAWSINVMSAFFSALTVYTTYHLIHFFGEKMTNMNGRQKTSIIALASFCGSLCLTFSDTFWFSAVEAETYGIACFFLVLIVWLILKGNEQSEPNRSRYLVLILYTAGLSYCIHPMCLLALPLLPFVWYVNSGRLTLLVVTITSLVGLVTVLLINRLIAIGLFELAFSFDLFFVNAIHLPFYSGAIVLLGLLIVFFVWVLRKFPRFSAPTWSLIFLLVGFIPYIMLFIRSNHNPPIDENNPEDLSMIKAYMNRESYPSSPLLYGPYFDAQIESVNVKKNHYVKTADRYETSGTLSEYQYESSRKTILPRMYSNDADHITAYRQWMDLSENEGPRFADNLGFMFRYQLGHMYFRYLFWNFAGRENDHQNSAWLSPLDARKVSDEFNSKARNQYWMIPLIVGVAGMFVQFSKDRKGFISIMLFFLITGIVLALYLNSPPVEPRERDYIYIGSFIAFALWIGVGVASLSGLVARTKLPPVVVATFCLAIPLWMGFENWDDHNRTGRTFQVDNAKNILVSCQPNAILFTGGDNDTFPLWYLQEVEGYRTDVRVMVLSYFNTDWYINQLRKKYYESEPFELTLDEKAYRQYGPNDVLYIQESFKTGIDFRKYLQLLNQEHSALKVPTGGGDYYNILPSHTILLTVDDSVDNTPKPMQMALRVNGNYLQKNGLALLDVVASNHWKRPVYFNFTSLNTAGFDLDPYVIQEGNVYRLTPFENPKKGITIDLDLTAKNLIENADYSNLSVPGVYFNYEDYYQRMITPVRQSFNTLAEAYIGSGKPEMAEKVLLFAVENLYKKHLDPSYTNLEAADLLSSLGRQDVAKPLCASLFDFHFEQLQAAAKSNGPMNRLDMFLVERSAELLNKLGDTKYLTKIDALGLAQQSLR
ncbi:MAG TPA: DUF2723 domain-containing protein [Chryseolinea sp.]|nr:DUF2723 domain-containing protein [Chryseolinea sp.]